MSAAPTEENVEIVEIGLELKSLKDEWKWLVALGVLLVFVGSLAIVYSLKATVVSMMILGMVLLVGGIAQVLAAFRSPKWGGLLLQTLVGVLYVVAGYLVIESPEKAAAMLALLMSFFFIFGGLLRIIFALMYRFPNWGWTLLSGVISVFLGLMIHKEWPVPGLLVIGLFIGIEMIVTGWTFLALGLAARKLKEA